MLDSAIEIEDEVNAKKAVQKQEIELLDQEAAETIEKVRAKAKDGIELSDYIESLGHDWLNIEWNDQNRINKAAYQAR